MTKKKRNSATEKRNPGRLSAAMVLEGTLLAMRLLTQEQSDLEVCKALEKRFTITRNASKKILDQAFDRLRQASDTKTTPQRAAMAERHMLELYRQGIENGKLASAVTAIKHLHKLWGLLDTDDNMPAAARVTQEAAVAEQHGAGPFAERSLDELKFFNRHGYWPEEHRDKPAQTHSRDPLAALDKETVH